MGFLLRTTFARLFRPFNAAAAAVTQLNFRGKSGERTESHTTSTMIFPLEKTTTVSSRAVPHIRDVWPCGLVGERTHCYWPPFHDVPPVSPTMDKPVDLYRNNRSFKGSTPQIEP